MTRTLFLLTAHLVALFAVASGPQEEYVNAGVLPYSTETGEIMVLLGYDADDKHWSDFVGVCTPGERPAQTAARQFEEETRGAYQLGDIARRLQGKSPVEVGNTRIFLLEVPMVSGTQLSRLAKDRGFREPLDLGPDAAVQLYCLLAEPRIFALQGGARPALGDPYVAGGAGDEENVAKLKSLPQGTLARVLIRAGGAVYASDDLELGPQGR